MAQYSDATEDLEALAATLIPALRDAFLAAMQGIVDNVVLREVIDAFELGDPVAAFKALGLSDAALRPITKMIEDAYEAGGVTVGNTFPKRLHLPDGTTAVFRFDVRNSRAEQWLRENSSRLVTELQEEARVVVRNVLEDGMRRGVNPRTSALDLVGRLDSAGHRIGGTVGLTSGQERWVANTGRHLRDLNDLIKSGADMVKIEASPYFSRALRYIGGDRAILAKARKGIPLTDEEIKKLTSRYRANTLRYRGEVIARTEAIEALNRAQFEAINQAIDQGSVKRGAIARYWDSAGDKRTRPSHRMMEGQKVGFDEPFIFPGGSKAMYPCDKSLGAPADETVQCRCRVRTKIDWLADAVTYARRLPAAEREALRALAFAKLPGK